VSVGLTVMLAWIALFIVAALRALIAASEPDYGKGKLSSIKSGD